MEERSGNPGCAIVIALFAAMVLKNIIISSVGAPLVWVAVLTVLDAAFVIALLVTIILWWRKKRAPQAGSNGEEA